MAGKSEKASLLSELFAVNLYKSTQGRIVRQVTAIAIAIIAAFGLWTLSSGPLNDEARWVRVGVPFGLWILCSWVAFRAVNTPAIADFLIGVESEMEKVTWPGKTEVIRSTAVVIITMFFFAAVLFLFDQFWQWLFRLIHFVEY